MSNSLPEFRKEWMEQDLQLQALRQRLRADQVCWRVLSVVTGAGAVVAIVAGIWFALHAIHHRDLLYALSAFALLAAVPPAAIAELRARREGLKWHNQTPEGTIRHALRRTIIIERLLRISFFNGCVLTALVIVVWGCMLARLIPNQSHVLAITSIWLVFGAGSMLWVRSRRRVNRDQRMQCEKLLRDYAAIEDSHLDYNKG